MSGGVPRRCGDAISVGAEMGNTKKTNAGIVAAALAACLTGAPLHAEDKGPNMKANDVLLAVSNDRISSSIVALVMQSDCNLVAYQGGKAVWSSGTAKKGAGCTAVMQGDGNLVVYRADHKALWSSNTFHYPGGVVVAQNDGNVVIYQGGKARWATNTMIPRPTTAAGGGGSSPYAGCFYARTDTKCVIFTQWFKAVYQCGWNAGSMTPIEKSDGWKLSGGCVGFSW